MISYNAQAMQDNKFEFLTIELKKEKLGGRKVELAVPHKIITFNVKTDPEALL